MDYEINELRPGIIEYTDDDLGFKKMDLDYTFEAPQEPKKKTTRTRKPSSNSVCISNEEIKENTPLPVRFKDCYAETDGMLRQVLGEITVAGNSLEKDLSDIRNSRTLKNKYGYIKDLLPSQAQLINTKVSVIREMNSIIGKINDMEYKRIKDFKAGEDTDSDKLIMDLYSNILSNPNQFNSANQLPISTNAFVGTAPTSNVCIGSNPQTQQAVVSEVDSGYQNYLNNLTPEQNRMLLENNPNIKDVVCYNPNDGSTYFDVYDLSTNMPVPNVPKKNPMFLEHTQLDIQNGIARNSDLRQSYPIIIVDQATIDQAIRSKY